MNHGEEEGVTTLEYVGHRPLCTYITNIIINIIQVGD